MALLYLGLGSNIGDKKNNIVAATRICEALMGKLIALSGMHETEPWGFSSENNFINAAICLETESPAYVCLKMAKAIEREMGRTSKSKNGEYEDRIIDIDILFYDDSVMKTEELTIPHPHIAERLFVLKPMAEIAPDLRHPVNGKSIKELLNILLTKEDKNSSSNP